MRDNNPAGIIMEANQISQAVREAQEIQNRKDEAERHQRRMAAYADWVKPESIKLRWEQHCKDAADALIRGKAGGRDLELLPVPDPLPKHMVGQSASTIQSMLRYEKRAAMSRCEKEEADQELIKLGKDFLANRAPVFKISPIYKPAPVKLTRWQRLLAWFR